MRGALVGLVIIGGAGLLAACASPAAAPVTAQQSGGSFQDGSGSPSPAGGMASGGGNGSPAANSGGGAVPTSASTSHAVTGVVTDSQGDRMRLSLTIGQPEPLTGTSDQVAHSCDSEIDGGSSTLSQAVIYPVDTTETLLSSVAATVGLDYSAFFVNATPSMFSPAGVSALYTIDGPEFWWAGIVGGSGYCGDGSVEWQDQGPGQTETWDAYLVVAGAITPDDPTGLKQSAGPIVLSPDLSVDGVGGNFAIDTADSTNLVQCETEDTNGDVLSTDTYVAMDPKYAIASGCSQQR